MITQGQHDLDKIKPPEYLFNPFEIAFSGKSSPENECIITKLFNLFSEEYSVFYYNYDSQGSTVFFGKPVKPDFVIQRTILNNYDMVLISKQKNNLNGQLKSGKKKPEPAQIYFITDETENEIKKIDNPDILAYAGTNNAINFSGIKKPYFQLTDFNKIKEFIINYFSTLQKNIPLYGLILAGGKSTRMKADKSLLKYHDKTQKEVLFELLSPFCEKVFISERQGQEKFSGENFPVITDSFLEIGPMGGILSAMNNYPMAAWLVLACDLPFIKSEYIKNLIKLRNPFKIATAYKSSSYEFPEPLCTIYEPKSKLRIMQFLALGYSCPRKVLINSEITLINQLNTLALTNVNNPEEYENAFNYLHGQGKK